MHEVLKQEAVSVTPAAKVIPIGDGYDYNWKLSLSPGEAIIISYSLHSQGVVLSELVVEGLEEGMVTGARVI